jgi:hypothetical protein
MTRRRTRLAPARSIESSKPGRETGLGVQGRTHRGVTCYGVGRPLALPSARSRASTSAVLTETIGIRVTAACHGADERRSFPARLISRIQSRIQSAQESGPVTCTAGLGPDPLSGWRDSPSERRFG